jgi:hypothetical protein
VGDDEAVSYLREVLLPKAFKQGKLHIVTDPLVKVRCIYSPIFTVEKSNRDEEGRRQFRICQDLSAPLTLRDGAVVQSMNEHTPVADLPSVPLGTAQRIISKLAYTRLLAESRGYSHTDIRLVAIDLTDAYYQWLVNPRQQECVAFEFEGCSIIHDGLPFGSCLSPSVFCRFMHLLWCFLEQVCSVLCNWYMDDGVIIAFPPERAVRDHRLVLQVLKWMRVDTNEAKSMAAPAEAATSLGFVFEIPSWTVAIKASTIEKTLSLAFRLREPGPGHRWPGPRLAKLLESLVGLLCFVEQVIPTVGPIKRLFLASLRAAEAASFFSIGFHGDRALARLQEWLPRRNSAPIRLAELELANAPAHRMHTDASGGVHAGFGAWAVRPDGVLFALRGLWSDLTALPSDLTIADMELLTILMAIQLLLPRVWEAPTVVRLTTDNTNAQAWVNRLQCKADSPNQLRRLDWLADFAEHLFLKGMGVEAVWVASEDNALADAFSREERYHEIDSLLPVDVISVVYVQVPPEWLPVSLRIVPAC